MGFLGPWFLAGLVGLGLPVYIHLLKKHVTTPVPFSSLMFFERGTQSSVRHRRLRYLLLFALRVALVVLLALAFARPFFRHKVVLASDKLLLVVTDGCPGLAAAIQTVYPRAAHQRCWVHKMRNILEKVRKRDYDAVKTDAQAIYLADGRRQAVAAARAFCRRWRCDYPSLVKQLERDLPELLAFFRFPKHLWRKLRTTNIIERCFVEVRRRTRPMVCFVNVQSVDRIIYAIFQRFNLEWKTRTLRVFTQAA